MMIKLTQQLCDECTPLLSSNSLQQRTRELDVIVLEGVAKARYALALAAEFMYKSAVEDTGPWNELQIQNELRTLFEGVKRMCYKSLSPVPRLYLLKQLVRRFGVESIHVLCGLKEFEWIVPPENRDKQVNCCILVDTYQIILDSTLELRIERFCSAHVWGISKINRSMNVACGINGYHKRSFKTPLVLDDYSNN